MPPLKFHLAVIFHNFPFPSIVPPPAGMDPSLVGGLYIALGLIGASVNGATALMIVSKRVYRLSAYTMMANVALADAIMMLVAGLACGILLIWPAMDAAIER